ncbi:transcriptional regulator [Flavobacterium subsaxonicum]|uniref:transcriptional regulator n=1 Tax=Flavobacterium subsaxonicum TaxID=426226 RepID=UPI0003FDD6CE|nr:transcriptional regulator [Flavobacterium subsaxonicum]
MDWKPITTEAEYELAIRRTMELFHAQPNTPDGDELEMLENLINDYEELDSANSQYDAE